MQYSIRNNAICVNSLMCLCGHIPEVTNDLQVNSPKIQDPKLSDYFLSFIIHMKFECNWKLSHSSFKYSQKLKFQAHLKHIKKWAIKINMVDTFLHPS